MLHTKSVAEFLFVVDTNGFAGEFSSSLFAYVTGKHAIPGEETEADAPDAASGRSALKLDPKRENGPNPFFDGLLDIRVDDTGEGRRYCTVLQTPGMYVSNGDIVPADEIAGGAPASQHPAWASVGFFIKRPPTPVEVTHMKERAHSWTKTISIDVPAKPSILGFRLVWCQKAWSETSL